MLSTEVLMDLGVSTPSQRGLSTYKSVSEENAVWRWAMSREALSG